MTDKVNILVIDDEPIVGKRLKPALEKSGYNVDVCETGSEALERIHNKSYDIVVTDVRMDEVDGMEVLSRVTEKSPKTKVIIITGYATIEIAREAIAKGAFDFIAKPFKPNELREIIQKAIDALEEESN
ncbi:MAG: response regulator [candidate division Zixibacteria bacterium]|nr:response regulator [candidate division Zixibacteria bacterium]